MNVFCVDVGVYMCEIALIIIDSSKTAKSIYRLERQAEVHYSTGDIDDQVRRQTGQTGHGVPLE